MGGWAALLLRVAPEAGRGLALQFILFGVVYPCLAGLDPVRQPLYLNLCALGLLVFTAQLLVRRLGEAKNHEAAVVPATAEAWVPLEGRLGIPVKLVVLAACAGGLGVGNKHVTTCLISPIHSLHIQA